MKITAVYNGDGLMEFNIRPFGIPVEGNQYPISANTIDRIHGRLAGLQFSNFYKGGKAGQTFSEKIYLFGV